MRHLPKRFFSCLRRGRTLLLIAPALAALPLAAGCQSAPLEAAGASGASAKRRVDANGNLPPAAPRQPGQRPAFPNGHP